MRRPPLPATLVGVALAALVGCAPALPDLSGGRTTPVGRTDLAVGGAIRVPVGDLVAQPGAGAPDALLEEAAPGGAAPLAFVRHGVTDDVELGLDVSGTTLRASARGQLRAGMVRLIGGIAPYGGIVADPVRAGRLGATLPLVLALDVFSVVEAWVGLRASVEHAFGEDGAGAALSVTGVRTGGVVGIAVGFRRLHALVELGVDHELWTGSLGDTPIERTGVALTPAFAIRLRL